MLNVQKSIFLIAGMFACLTAQAMHKSKKEKTQDFQLMKEQIKDDLKKGLEAFMKEKGPWSDYSLFRAVQKIREVVKEEKCKARNHEVYFWDERMIPRWGLSRYQTRGLFLFDNKILLTPWGRLTLTQKCSGGGPLISASFEYALFKRLKTKHVGVECKEKPTGSFGCSTSKSPECFVLKPGKEASYQRKVPFWAVFDEMSKKELERKKENEIFVYCPTESAGSIQKVLQIDDIKLRDPGEFEEKEFENCIGVAWCREKFQNRYYEEQKIK